MDGRVAEHFSGVGYKRLVAVECSGLGVSNQHEIGSSASMRAILGTERRIYGCTYLFFRDEYVDDSDFTKVDSTITYYDSRQGQQGRSPEYRLFYPENPVMAEARVGDYCWLGRLAAEPDRLMVIVAEAGSAVSRQLDRLLGTSMRHEEDAPKSTVLKAADLSRAGDDGLTMSDDAILRVLGVPVVEEFSDYLHVVVQHFGQASRLPPVKEFCSFVRDLCPTVGPGTEIDRLLHEWFAFTNEMFLGLERHIVQPVIDREFANKERIDPDRFFEVARRFQQSRFSRAGLSWESHLEEAFLREGVSFVHNRRKIKDGTKPDFIFPSFEAYEDSAVSSDLVSFVGAKTTTKERWMQLVAEGGRARESFLATMDRDLNHDVLTTMENHRVIPVIPSTFVAATYGTTPPGVISFADLMEIVRDREARFDALGR